MSAAVHLLLGPPDSDAASRLAAVYRDAAPGATAVLVPTRRHADAFRGILLGPNNPACLLPRVFDLQAFADDIVRVTDPPLRPLSDVQRRWLLDVALTELRDGGELGPFAAAAETRGFADAAAGAVAELQAARADLRQLLKVSGRRESSEKFPVAVRVFDRYHRRLAKLHRLDPADRLGRAAGHWLDDRRGPFADVRAVLVHGFTSLTPAQQHLLDALRQTLDHVWLSLPDEGGDARAETFASPRLLRAWVEAAAGTATLFNQAAGVEVEAVPTDDGRPAGLRHLAATLFREDVAAAADAAGLHLIEAPARPGRPGWRRGPSAATSPTASPPTASSSCRARPTPATSTSGTRCSTSTACRTSCPAATRSPASRPWPSSCGPGGCRTTTGRSPACPRCCAAITSARRGRRRRRTPTWRRRPRRCCACSASRAAARPT